MNEWMNKWEFTIIFPLCVLLLNANLFYLPFKNIFRNKKKKKNRKRKKKKYRKVKKKMKKETKKIWGTENWLYNADADFFPKRI